MFTKTFFSILSRVIFVTAMSAAVISMFVATTAFADVRDGDSLAQLVADAKPGDWVAFDIDHTLLYQVQAYGSEVWFGRNIGRLMKAGLSNNAAFQATVQESREINQVTAVRETEPNLPSLVQQLKDRGVAVFAFTARNSRAAELTVRQLREVGLDFSDSAPGLRDEMGSGVEHAVMKNGVLYSNEKSKGETFAALLRATFEKPRRLFMADDKKKNLTSVEQTSLENNIPFEGLRYSRLDHLEHSYDSVIADYQREHFKKTGKLLSDSAAGKLVDRAGLRCAALFN